MTTKEPSNVVTEAKFSRSRQDPCIMQETKIRPRIKEKKGN